VVFIGHIAVLPSMLVKGLGTRLMNYLANVAKEVGFSIVSVDVAETNPSAGQLHEHLDYKEIEFSKKDLHSECGQVCGHSYMELKLM
jgi:GNAT superfamily N-acetyltransferase